MALSEPQQALADTMSDISEFCWFAGWMRGTEYFLWHFAVNAADDASWGNYVVSQESRARLKRLSDDIGGWIVWSDAGATFIALNDWRDRFDAWERAQKAATE